MSRSDTVERSSKPGALLARRYRVLRLLGEGSVGRVVAAHDVMRGREVAVKFLLADATREIERRFLRGAKAAMSLRSQHIVRVRRVGSLSDGRPYMVMELLEGQDLGELLAVKRKVAVAEAVELILQACEGVAVAHGHGVIHRDLKPANLFVSSTGGGAEVVKVLDFGMAKVSTLDEGSGSVLTGTTAIMGSPFYMSPEQMRSTRNVDLRTDIWALGVILYELVAGVRPFQGNTLPELFQQIRRGVFPPINLEHVPQEFIEAISTAVGANVEEGCNNVAEFAYQIAPFGGPDAITHAFRIAEIVGVAGDMPRPVGFIARDDLGKIGGDSCDAVQDGEEAASAPVEFNGSFGTVPGLLTRGGTSGPRRAARVRRSPRREPTVVVDAIRPRKEYLPRGWTGYALVAVIALVCGLFAGLVLRKTPASERPEGEASPMSWGEPAP